MLDSQARIVESPRRIGVSGDAGDAERAVDFHFQVLWSTLFIALESAKLTVPAVALSEFPVPEPAPILSPRSNEARTETGSTVQWEMVIPKMARPVSRITAAPEPAPPPPPRPEPLPIPHAGAPSSVLQIGTERHWVFRMRPGTLSFTSKLIIGGALAAGVSIPIVLRGYLPHTPASVETATRSGSWMREPSTPAGANQAAPISSLSPVARRHRLPAGVYLEGERSRAGLDFSRQGPRQLLRDGNQGAPARAFSGAFRGALHGVSRH